MDIIFLDIDGVLRTHKSDLWWSQELNEPIPTKVFDRKFRKKSVSNINYITSFSGAKIVVTSTWRLNFTLNELKGIFKERGITGEIIDKTDIGLKRGEEILDWIDLNNVQNYVVIDDQVKGIRGIIEEERIIEVNCFLGFEDDSLTDKALDCLL